MHCTMINNSIYLIKRGLYHNGCFRCDKLKIRKQCNYCNKYKKDIGKGISQSNIGSKLPECQYYNLFNYPLLDGPELPTLYTKDGFSYSGHTD